MLFLFRVLMKIVKHYKWIYFSDLIITLFTMHQYDTVSQAITDLKARGYAMDFNLVADGIECRQMPAPLKSSEFEITEVYRFEGDSDPADEAIVYAIESKHGLKGVMVNGYGASADALSDDMVKKLSVNYDL